MLLFRQKERQGWKEEKENKRILQESEANKQTKKKDLKKKRQEKEK